MFPLRWLLNIVLFTAQICVTGLKTIQNILNRAETDAAFDAAEKVAAEIHKR